MKKVLFIYNPMAGGRNISGKLDHILGRFLENELLAVPYRTSINCSTGIPALLYSGDYTSVVVSGGDGTLNSIANQMLKNNINLPLGVIPSGTCNDFARSLGIPHDLDKCLDIIFDGHIMEIDTGIINNKTYFINTCAGGVFAGVTYSTGTGLKRSIGPLAYYLKALSEVVVIKPFRIDLVTESRSIDDSILLFIIMNGRHAGGFSNVIRKADLSDGVMDIVLIRSCIHIDLAALFIKALNNDFQNDRNVISFTASTCSIKTESPIILTMDGEKGPELPIDVRFVNKNLKVYIK